MFKKDDLEEFLFLFNKAENIPFTHFEDALINNYDALDVPFTNYCKLIIGWSDFLKTEISENLLSLSYDDKKFYLKYLIRKLKLETGEHDNKNLFDLLKFYNVDKDVLDFNKNKLLKELLYKSFKSVLGIDNLNKLRDLHKEYYLYLLFIERNKILKYLDELIEDFGLKNESSIEAYKNTIWFKVGVLLASGKMDKYYKITKDGGLYFNPAFTSPRVAEDLGDIKYDKYILATIKNYQGDKNIFNYRDKMMKIITHCEEQNISVIPYFTKRLPPE